MRVLLAAFVALASAGRSFVKEPGADSGDKNERKAADLREKIKDPLRKGWLAPGGRTNELSEKMRLNNFNDFKAKDGSTMTSWTGTDKVSIIKRRKYLGMINPWWSIHKGHVTLDETKEAEPTAMLTYKSWFNPFTPQPRRSVRDADGKTVNRVHFNQLRRWHARVRAHITTPGDRMETWYTMSKLGFFGKYRGKKKEFKWLKAWLNTRANIFTLTKGQCTGTTTNSRCRGTVYVAVSENRGHKITLFTPDGTEVAQSQHRLSAMGFIEWIFIGEKNHFDLTISKGGQDNLALTEFVTWIVDLETNPIELLKDGGCNDALAVGAGVGAVGGIAATAATGGLAAPIGLPAFGAAFR